MSQYSSYMQDNKDNTRSYPTPDNTQPLTNNLPRNPGTFQSSQSNTTQIVDSFLSDVPQGAYSEYSTLDNLSTIPTIIQDLAPHTPESLLYSPVLDELTELNSRKQREQPLMLRRSPRISSNQTPQTSERKSDSTSLNSQDGSNNRELINKNPAALALKVLNESTDLQQLLSEQEMNTLKSRNLNNLRMEQEFSTSLVDTENRDIDELRDLITTSNMILDSVHHSSVSYKNQGVDDEMKDIEYTHEQLQKGTNGTFKQPQEISRSELEIENENENEYSENVDLVIANEISDTLLRQSEHYNSMASKFSNLKFIKVTPESEEEIEQFTTSITPGIRRSTRKRTTANYSYPRYSYGGGSSRRSRTRKRSRSFRKGTLSVTKNKVNVASEPVNIDNERNEEIDEPVLNLSPIEEQEANKYSHDIQDADDSGNVDENILDNELQSNLYLKHDLRSRKIMLELPEVGLPEVELPEVELPEVELPEVVVESEGTEEEPVASSSKKTTRPKQLAKKHILKTTSKKSAKTIPKRRTSRRSTSRKKNEDREWRPDEDDNELDDDIEAVTMTPRSRHVVSKTRLSSKASTAPKKVTVDKNVKSYDDAIPAVSNTKRISSKKSTPKISKPPKTTRKGKKPAQSNGGREKSRGGITRGSRSKNCDTEYKYSGGEETESEVEIDEPIPEVVDTVDDNSENHVIRDAEMNDIQGQNVAVVKEPVSTLARPKRARKSNKSSVSEPLINTPKSSRSNRSRDGNKRSGRKDANTQVNEDTVRNIYEPLDNETANVPEVQGDLIPPTQPKKKTRSVKGKGRGGKVKGRDDHVSSNTSAEQPIVPISDPCIVEISSGSVKTLENAVRVLSEKNFDIVHSPGNIASIDGPVFAKPATRSTSLSSTPPPEPQAIQTQSSSHNTPGWSSDHWRYLKVFYDETKNEYLRSGKVVTGSEAVYREVTKKFYDADINNRTFGEEILRNRIIALETTDSEKSSEPSGSTQRRSSIESSSSRGSRSSVSRYNKAYSNPRNGTKRKRSESNATTTPEGKKEDSNKEDGEAEGKVSKRHRVEENTPSGSGTTTPSHDANIPQTSPNNSVFSRLFGGWFNRGQSQSETST